MKEVSESIERQRNAIKELHETQRGFLDDKYKQQKKAKIAGMNTLKGIIANNRNWLGSLLIALIVLLISIALHLNGLL